MCYYDIKKSYPRGFEGNLFYFAERMVAMKKAILDTETGELIDEVFPGDRILRKNSIEFLKKKDEEDDGLIEINKGRPFIKLYDDVAEDLATENLTGAEFSILLLCISHLSYVSGAIIERHTGEFITPTKFEKDTGLGRTTVWRAIQGLVDRGILFRGETKEEFKLFANPYIFMKGRKINRTLFEMFRTTKWYRKHKWELEVGEY